MSTIKGKIEEIIKSKLSEKHKTIFYYGRIVDKFKGYRMNLDTLNPVLFTILPPFYKFKGYRMNLDTLNPVLFTILPPFYKFKKYTNDNFYKAAIAKFKTCTRFSDTIDVYYDGSSSDNPLIVPIVSLYVYLPYKNCDIMIVSYDTKKLEESNKKVIETIKREIVEYKSPQLIIKCIKAQVDQFTLYELSVDLVNFSLIKQLIFEFFEDSHCKKRVEEKLEEEINF